LLLGNLDGIATVAGLHLVATEVLPALEKLMGPGGFVLKVAGAGTLPKSLTGRFERPSVRLQGFVPTVAGALAESHVLLVPTPIRLGFRTRIAEAFSCSAAVVAHEANKAGMPELVHGQNVLLGGTGNELAEHLVRLARDGTERARLGAKARRTYEEKLEARKVCGKMIGILESVAKEGKTR
jgi:glycosyltransferase involved in cell wall biosynthesis